VHILGILLPLHRIYQACERHGGREEPVWPEFPPEEARERHRVAIGGGAEKAKPKTKKSRPEEYCNHQAAALWLSKAENLFDITKRPWLRDIARAYGPWTAVANGAGLKDCDSSYHFPSEWNDAYFALLAHCLPGLELQAIDELALKPICSLPDDPFFDVMVPFLQRLDVIFFNDGVIEIGVAISVRSTLANQMMSRWCWKRLRGSQGTSIEVHIGPAIATLFFNEAGVFSPAKCYLLPKGIDQIAAYLPILAQLAESAPSFFVANVTLNLVEVSPRSSHLPFLISAAKAWFTCYFSARDFWVDYGIGHRLCAWIEVVWRQEPNQLDTNQKLRTDLDGLLAALVRLGVAEARHLEEALAQE